jgi:hypothetical protein
MSTRTEPLVKTDEPPQDDPFYYGWRYRRRVLPDGREELVQVPLTLEDVIHPQEEDFRMQTPAHWDDCAYLYYVFKLRLAGNPRARVTADCRVAWAEAAGVEPHGPDVGVFLDVERDIPKTKGTFPVEEAGARAALIVEVASNNPDTRKGDLVVKVEEYHKAGVVLYVIVNANDKADPRTLELIGYRWQPDGYERLEPDAQGRLWLEPVRVWLGVKGSQVVCYDGDTGEEIGDYTAMAQAREVEAQARQAAEARAVAEAQAREAEAQARQAAETRLRELEAELRRLRGEAEPK